MTRHLQKNNQYTLIIIGGGASGLAASCIAAENNIKTLLIEKNNKLGKKLLATGNGRCNILNSGKPLYFGDKGFAEDVLKHCNFNRLTTFFEKLGLVLRQEDGGRIYPAANRSDVVLGCLVRKAENGPITIQLDESLVQISKSGDLWQVKTDKGIYTCNYLLVAGGSTASPKLGGSATAVDCLLPLGFKFAPFKPALCPIECKLGKFKSLKGLRLFAICTLLEINGNKKTARAASVGEVLFTEYGLSGVCIMQLAGFVEQEKNYEICLDLSPSLESTAPQMGLINPESIDKNTTFIERLLNKRSAFLEPDELLFGALPNNLAKLLLGKSIKQTAINLTQLHFPVLSLRGIDFSQAAKGGIKTQNINPATMESYYKNLYLAGEILNVLGDCGGYNLMFAFAGGILAAEDIARKIKDQ